METEQDKGRCDRISQLRPHRPFVSARCLNEGDRVTNADRLAGEGRDRRSLAKPGRVHRHLTVKCAATVHGNRHPPAVRCHQSDGRPRPKPGKSLSSTSCVPTSRQNLFCGGAWSRLVGPCCDFPGNQGMHVADERIYFTFTTSVGTRCDVSCIESLRAGRARRKVAPASCSSGNTVNTTPWS